MTSPSIARTLRGASPGHNPHPETESELLYGLLPNYRDGESYPCCIYCGAYAELLDHRVPKKQGGGEGGNLVQSCGYCNRHKSGRTPEQAGMVILFPTGRREDRYPPYRGPSGKFYDSMQDLLANEKRWGRK